METNGFSPADISAMMGGRNDCGNSWLWIIVLLLFLGGGQFGLNRGQGEFSQYATAASQNEILLGQKFDALGQKVNQIGDGICSSTYSLNNAITGEGRTIQNQLSSCCCDNQRNVDALRFDMSNYSAAAQAAIHAEGEQTRALLQQNKIESLSAQVQQLQMNAALCGVVRYPNATTYTAGASPFCNCGCSNI